MWSSKLYRTLKMTRRQIPEILKKYQKYLKEGHYYIDVESGISAYHEDETISDYNKGWSFNTGSYLQHLIKKIVVKMTSKDMYVGGGDKSLLGSIVKVHYSFEYFKIFDFESKKVLTLYNDPKEVVRLLEQKEILSRVFKVPAFDRVFHDVFIEALIDDKGFGATEVFEALSAFLLTYFNSVKTENIIFKDLEGLLNKYKKNDLMTELIEQLGDLQGQFPSVLLHGDCWKSNLILNDDGLYFIDYETVGHYFFMYDYFKYIYAELIYNNNDVLIGHYLKGTYDEQIDLYFKAFGMSFEKALRKQYVILFLAILYGEKMNHPDQHKHKAFKVQIRYIVETFLN